MQSGCTGICSDERAVRKRLPFPDLGVCTYLKVQCGGRDLAASILTFAWTKEVLWVASGPRMPGGGLRNLRPVMDGGAATPNARWYPTLHVDVESEWREWDARRRPPKQDSKATTSGREGGEDDEFGVSGPSFASQNSFVFLFLFFFLSFCFVARVIGVGMCEAWDDSDEGSELHAMPSKRGGHAQALTLALRVSFRHAGVHV
ncbi:predicted protein [Coccidioides posadasii str. Silveira]|uniref:Predicted protein n=1 Tax=Coccidioides posadasii (strain RMSCC 757 / Silveira) TaxID=443226 RepID=E9DA64_COCPS|nr:predicted protein [Coccidioides posadasii str. Silveira]